ncbi:MAG: IclR family transcriptional regulator [Deltaproteobacteria bacterium]|nr:IclR family transcriptional regulator [Deltaproteobacteria bacterium]
MGGRVESVVRAIRIIQSLADGGDEKSLTEVAREVGLHTATARRLLMTLMGEEFVRQNGRTKKYSLGLPLLVISQRLRSRLDLRQIALPYLQELMERSGETANLAVEDKGEAVYIEQVECRSSLRTANKVGSRAPLYCTAVGKILLAARPAEEREKFLRDAPLLSLTRKTITEPDRLLRELRRVARENLAVDHEEQMIGERCLATGLRDQTGQAVGAVSVSGPAFRMTPRRLRELALILSEIGGKISREMGFEGGPSPWPPGRKEKSKQGEAR